MDSVETVALTSGAVKQHSQKSQREGDFFGVQVEESFVGEGTGIPVTSYPAPVRCQAPCDTHFCHPLKDYAR